VTPAADEHLVFVGLMGTGKSTVARLAAERLHRPFVDSDDLVESRAGRTVREIWRCAGEAAFRRLEAEALAEVLQQAEPVVIAAAGGVVLSAENRAALIAARARVVWLHAPVATLVQRVGHGGHRPLLDDDPQGALGAMAAEREALYREVADISLSTEGRTPHDVVEAALQ
jgi:shikimate kinase